MKHPVDVHVGKRVRHRRWIVGYAQAAARRHRRHQVPADPEVRNRDEPDQRFAALGHRAGAGGLDQLLLRGLRRGGQAGPGRRRAPTPAATCSPTRRRSSWCAPTTRSPRRSGAGCSTSPPRPQRRGLSRAPRLTASAASRTPPSEGRGVRRGHGMAMSEELAAALWRTARDPGRRRRLPQPAAAAQPRADGDEQGGRGLRPGHRGRPRGRAGDAPAAGGAPPRRTASSAKSSADAQAPPA